jgi:predicted DNA-binding transcriptional regulator YafY
MMRKSTTRIATKKRLPSEANSPRPEADRRLRQADRLARVMRTLQLLLSRGRWKVQDIAAEQECSVRTIYRVKEVLELAGISVDTDRRDHCLRIRPDFRFPSLNVTEEEALAQGTATAITAGPGLDITAGAKPVTRKLAMVAKEEVAQVLADAEALVAVLDLKLADHSRHREIIRTIQWALVKRKQAIGTYRSPYEAGEVKLQLHPYRLCLVKQAWYLVARPDKEQFPRTFRVARFKTLRMSEINAHIPEDFSLQSYFGNAWAVYRGTQSFDVEIVFSPDVAAIVTEGVWHPTQKARKHKNGAVTLTFQVDGLNEIVRWVLGWGSGATVIQPAELREMVLAQLHRSLEAYRA